MKEKTINMSIRIDKNLKKQADSLFKELGLNTTAAVTMFIKQCIREQSIPFRPVIEKKETEIMEDPEELIAI